MPGSSPIIWATSSILFSGAATAAKVLAEIVLGAQVAPSRVI